MKSLANRQVSRRVASVLTGAAYLFSLAAGAALAQSETVRITTTQLNVGVVGVPYSTAMTAAACSPCSWSAQGLPAGASIDAQKGAITATWTAGSAAQSPYPITVTARDGASGRSASRTFKLVFASRTIMYLTNLNETAQLPEKTPGSAMGMVSFAEATSDGPRRGVLLNVLGFSGTQACITDETEPPEKKTAQLTTESNYLNGTGASARSLGFDTYVLDWCDGSDYFQRSAALFAEVLGAIRFGRVGLPQPPGRSTPRGGLAPGEKLIVLAQSNGGLITRYGLARKEAEQSPHGVDLWITFDSPHKGAWNPIGTQLALKYLRTFTSGFLDDAARNDLGLAFRPAARQIAIIHADGAPRPPLLGPHRDFRSFFDELKNRWGNYPAATSLRRVAIANGSGGGGSGIPTEGLIWRPSGKKLKTILPIYIAGFLVWSGDLTIEVRPPVTLSIFPLTRVNFPQTVFAATRSTVLAVNGIAVDPLNPTVAVRDLLHRALGIQPGSELEVLLYPLLDGLIARTLREVSFGYGNSLFERIEVQAPFAYDTIPGGHASQTKLLANNLKAKGDLQGGSLNNLAIPTASALGIGGGIDDPFPPSTDLTKIADLRTPFHQVYFHGTNTGHIDNTDFVKHWLCREFTRLLNAPVITSVEPAVQTVGRREFRLTVRGENFTAQTKILWTGQERATTFVSSAKLRTLISAQDIARLPSSPQGCGLSFLAPCRIEVALSDARLDQTSACGAPSASIRINPTPVVIDPPEPTADNKISALLADDWLNACVPQNPRVTISGNRIDVNTTSVDGICSLVVLPYRVTAEFGPLPVGQYEVVFTNTRGSARSELGRREFTVRQAQPVVSGLSPVSTPAGGDAFPLTVTGLNFVAGASTVVWNGVPLATRFVSERELVASVPAERTARPGSADLTVTSQPGSAAETSTPFPFRITPPPPRVSRLAPGSAPAGAPGLVLALEGRDFTRSSVVLWNGPSGVPQQRSTRFVSGSRIEATLQAGDLSIPGSYSLVVRDGELASDPVLFRVEGTLAPVTSGGAGDTAPAVIPQVASGGGFTTEFQIFNLRNEPVPFRLRFVGNGGTALALPLADADGQLLGEQTSLDGVVPPGGVLFRKATRAAELRQGYAVLEEGAGALAVSTTFTQEVEGHPPFQASIPLSAPLVRARLPFLNTRSRTTAMAWVNRNSSSQMVNLIARGPDGVELCRSTRQLAPGAHEAFPVANQVACTAGVDGLLEIEAVDGPGVAAIGLFFDAAGPFTSNPPILPGSTIADLVIPQVANGADFKTEFQIFNLADVPGGQTYDLRFSQSNGTPLALATATPSGALDGLSEALTGIVPPGGVVFRETFPTAALRSGYAVQQAGAGLLAVNATFTQQVAGRPPFQASIPLRARMENARLPFSNQRPITTTLALVNPEAIPQTVTLIARGENGVELCRDSHEMAAGAHEAFAVQQRLSCTTGARGVIEIQGAGSGVASVGLFFHELGPFTSNLPVACDQCSSSR